MKIYQTNLKIKLSVSSFSHYKIFCWDLIFCGQNGENYINKKLIEKLFCIGIDLECSKINFRMKISKSLVFSTTIFFLRLSVCFGTMVKSCNVKLVNFCQNCEKIAKLIFLVKYLFDYN